MLKKCNLGLSVLIFSTLFLQKIGFIDLKSIVMIIFLVLSLMPRNGMYRRLVIDKRLLGIVFSIVCLMFIFIINSFFNINLYYTILFRYIRCLLSIVAIYSYFRLKKFSIEEFVDSFTIVLLLHACAIILSVIFPEIRSYIDIISGYSKKILPLRSSGLVSGYDFAGYYLNIGIIIRIVYDLRNNRKIVNIKTIILVVAVLFTSRVNTIILIIIICSVLIWAFFKGKISSGLSLLIIIPIVIVGSVFSILTIETFEPIKNELISKYDWIATLDKTINLTYSDGSFDDAISSHYNISDEINIVIGNGIQANRDPGIIKTIYEGGILALIVKFISYFYVFLYCWKRKRGSIVCLISCLNIMLTTIMEFKLQFYFSTGAFEVFIMLFILSFLNEDYKRYFYEKSSMNIAM